MIFTIKTLNVGNYKRNYDNLVFTTTVSLADALCSKPVRVETLDGRVLKVSLDQVITPKTSKVVVGEGMPIYNPNDEANLE